MLDVGSVLSLANAGYTKTEIEEILAPKDTNGNSHTDPAAGQQNQGFGQQDPAAGPQNQGSGQQDPAAGQQNQVAGQQNQAAGQQNPQNNPQPVDITEVINKAIAESMEELTKALVKNSIAGSRQPEQATGDDILGQIIAPPMVERNGGK